MKLSFYLAFVGFICYNTSLASRAVLIGHITGSRVKIAEASYNKSRISYEDVKQSAPIDKKGNYRLVFDIGELTEIYLSIDQQHTSFYLQPGDSIVLRNDYQTFDESIVFNGNGSAKNTFYNAFRARFIYGHEQDVFDANARLKAGPFAAYCDSLLGDQLQYCEANSAGVSSEFKEAFITSLKYRNGVNKMNYQSLWSYLNDARDSLPDLPATYYRFMLDLPVSDSRLLKIPACFEYFRAVVGYYRKQYLLLSRSDMAYEQSENFFRVLFQNEEIVEACMAFRVVDQLKYYPFDDAMRAYLSFSKAHPASPYAAELDALYNRIRKIAPGQPAPEFTLKGLDGREHNLNEFRGKVVYIDFWASWCGPCLMEMPASKKLEQKFRDSDVVFLYISIDDDAKSWQDMVKKKEIAGVHLHAPGFEHAVATSYNISGVPSYFLIDREGKMIDNAAPRPSSVEIEQAILEALATGR